MSLESHIQNIGDLTTKTIGSESDDNVVQPELEMWTEQEFRVIQISNAISSYIENEDVSPINLNKETKPLTLDVVSQNNSLPKIKTPSQIENEVLLTSQTLNTKIKTKSCHHSKSLSKLSSKSSSSSRHTYVSILERHKTAEQVNLLAIQAEERSKRKLKFLEKSFELEKEKLLDQVIEARNKAALVELERKHDEDIASSRSADSVKEQFKTLCFFMLI